LYQNIHPKYVLDIKYQSFKVNSNKTAMTSVEDFVQPFTFGSKLMTGFGVSDTNFVKIVKTVKIVKKIYILELKKKLKLVYGRS
jgi:hypothetical protein